jgi:hypothetical protein
MIANRSMYVLIAAGVMFAGPVGPDPALASVGQRPAKRRRSSSMRRLWPGTTMIHRLVTSSTCSNGDWIRNRADFPA